MTIPRISAPPCLHRKRSRRESLRFDYDFLFVSQGCLIGNLPPEIEGPAQPPI